MAIITAEHVAIFRSSGSGSGNLPQSAAPRWPNLRGDRDVLDQIGCTLFADDARWMVPGSHDRDDLPEELAAVPGAPARAASAGLDLQALEPANESSCRRMAQETP